MKHVFLLRMFVAIVRWFWPPALPGDELIYVLFAETEEPAAGVVIDDVAGKPREVDPNSGILWLPASLGRGYMPLFRYEVPGGATRFLRVRCVEKRGGRRTFLVEKPTD